MRKYPRVTGDIGVSDCPWCNNGDRNNLEFAIIDDDFGQYVKSSMIEFCPFCGRRLRG